MGREQSSAVIMAICTGDRLFYMIVDIIVFIVAILMLYPLIYILSCSFSSGEAVASGKVILWPVDLSLEGYRAVFENKDVIIGYRNTIFYTVVGTMINVAMTLMAAYPMARKNLPYKGVFTFLFAFTMLFNGGMMPNYILMKNLRIINTVYAMILPGAISVYNMIITRTFIQNTIPAELYDAANIDGCNDTRLFFSIVLPLSKAIIAVITLYYAVDRWNAYFDAFLYLNNKDLFPLQIFLRDILVSNTIDSSLLMDPELMAAKRGLADLLKYSLIVVSTVPILCLYPFVQKYFIQGVMIGSLKG